MKHQNPDMVKVALWYKHTHGVSIIPCKDKRPLVKSWKSYQQDLMSDEEIQEAFKDAPQIATICGIVSNGLEVIDFDIKHLAPLDRELFWDTFINDVMEVDNELFKKLQINKTQSGGYHVLYRSEEIDGNKKLTNMIIDGRKECIIETRGEGGYVIAPPSPGYEVTEKDNYSIQLISSEQRETLLNICRSYNEVQEVKPTQGAPKKHRDVFKKSPFEDFNEHGDIVLFLTQHGWKAVQETSDKIFFRRPGSENFQSANWHKSKRIFYVFSNGDIHLEGGRGYSATQVYTLIAHKGDYKESYKALRKQGYGTPWTDDEKEIISQVRSMAGADINNIRKRIIKERPSWLDDEIDKIIEAATQLDEDTFWFVNDRGNVMVNALAFNQWLHRMLGYALWDNDEKDKPLIKIDKEKHQVELILSLDIVKSDVAKWLVDNIMEDEEVSADQVMTALINKDSKLFSRAFFEWLPAVPVDTFNDTVEFAFFFFRNGIVKVSADNVCLIPYEEVPDNTFIWRDRIKGRDFDVSLIPDVDGVDQFLDKSHSYTYVDKKSKKTAIGTGSAWYKYVRRISGIGPEYDNTGIHELPETLTNRLRSTMSIIGYLLHSFKDVSRPWAIIINEDTPTDGKGGGSGKQIFTKGLSVLRNLKEEDGRQLNIKERFAFQGVSEDHDLFVMDDVPKWFKLESMYRMFTNDMVIEVRNVGRKTIPFKNSPKFVFSTNYDITGTEEANHLKRRVKQLLFECYYSPDNMPINEIGMLLDAGWEKDDMQWQLFFNFMFLCVLTYLNSSVIELPQTEKTIEKKIRNQFGDEFYEFMQDIFDDDQDWKYDWWVIKPVWQAFRERYDSKMSYIDFKKQLLKYMDILKIEYEKNPRYIGRSSFTMDEFSDDLYYKKIWAIKVIDLEATQVERKKDLPPNIDFATIKDDPFK